MIEFIAWMLVCFIGALVVALPFCIGEQRGPFTADLYVVGLFDKAAIVAVCGRVLGWW